MGKLTDYQIKQIVQTASLIQKFSRSKASVDLDHSPGELKDLFEITDDLNLDRKYVLEAYHNHQGIPVLDPIITDTNSFSQAKVTGFASGQVDSELINEMKARIEYHFNTVGKVSTRRDKITWKAKPTGFSRLIASSNSPEVEFKNEGSFTRISIRQSLKTLNKLFIPAMAAGFGGFMLLAAVLFDQVGTEIAPPLIFSGLILLGTFFYTRFVNNRKKKKKQSLAELTELLQQVMERKFMSPASSEEIAPGIEIPDVEQASEADGLSISTTQKMKE